MQHCARNQQFHLGPRLNTPQLRNLDCGTHEPANEWIGKIQIRLRVASFGQLLLHVKELAAVTQAASVTLGVQGHHPVDLELVGGENKNVAQDRPVDIFAVG